MAEVPATFSAQPSTAERSVYGASIDPHETANGYRRQDTVMGAYAACAAQARHSGNHRNANKGRQRDSQTS